MSDENNSNSIALLLPCNTQNASTNTVILLYYSFFRIPDHQQCQRKFVQLGQIPHPSHPLAIGNVSCVIYAYCIVFIRKSPGHAGSIKYGPIHALNLLFCFCCISTVRLRLSRHWHNRLLPRLFQVVIDYQKLATILENSSEKVAPVHAKRL